MIDEGKIRDRLVEHGEELFNAPHKPVAFTQIDAADAFLNDLENFPHAFVLASIMDQQIKAERAWLIPFYFREKLQGDFSMKTLVGLSLKDIHKLMNKPKPLHRYVDKMAEFFFKAVQKIASEYRSDASLIWKDNPSSATVVYRFLEFNGIGPKIATMDANILAREFRWHFRTITPSTFPLTYMSGGFSDGWA